MESMCSANETRVQLPVFPMASGAVARLIELSGTVLPTSTDEFGEYFAMSLIRVTPSGEVQPESTIVIPLAEAGEEEQSRGSCSCGCTTARNHCGRTVAAWHIRRGRENVPWPLGLWFGFQLLN